MALTRIRRVVTGVDDHGRSKVVWDGPSPNERESKAPGFGIIDLWVWKETPLPLDDTDDPATWSYAMPGPAGGGHLRVVNAYAKASDPSQVPPTVPPHDPIPLHDGRVWDRGGGNDFDRTAMHKTQSVDYGIVLAGERDLVLDSGTTVMDEGDVVVQVGAWHLWDSSRRGTLMAFDMVGADFSDGSQGTVPDADTVDRMVDGGPVPSGVDPVRRIVTIDKKPGESSFVDDGPSPDVRTDPARPGFALHRMWVIDQTPARIVPESLHLPHVLEPPPSGSVLNMFTIPPDASWEGGVGPAEVTAWFEAIGSPGASRYAEDAPHPYLQRTRTVDFCFVLKGEVVLVLDTEEVGLTAGDVVIQRGTNHAWSNRSEEPVLIAIASHDAKEPHAPASRS